MNNSDLSGQRVLLTGATGFLGGATAVILAGQGAQVRALARRPEKGVFLKSRENIEIVQGDITDAERMRSVSEGCDYVVHVAAALGGTLKYQERMNVEGTRNVMLGAASAGVKRVVHVSSIAVYGYHYEGDITEDFIQKPGRVPYNITKSQAEMVVREIGTAHDVPYSIIRPGMIYGPRSNAWTKTIFRLARLRPTPFLGDGSGFVHPIYVDDVVSMIVAALTHPMAVGEAFNCSADPAPTWRAFIGGYSQLAGHSRWLALPVFPMKIISPLIETLLTLRGEPQELPALITFLSAHKTYRTTKAQELLGWSAQVSLQTGIQRCAPWLREQGLLHE
ncbi:MAG: NAD-dependent epimerase/dehydratase family protein [Anaerolineae bacterium]|nr:NAD-dependent epimerase/dehydratase family protein [Anaerolineae bacterium]MBN8617439.1 NAD-dependent epimerase/dehydratase family protein [Anaerolineae bacterium]